MLIDIYNCFHKFTKLFLFFLKGLLHRVLYCLSALVDNNITDLYLLWFKLKKKENSTDALFHCKKSQKERLKKTDIK